MPDDPAFMERQTRSRHALLKNLSRAVKEVRLVTNTNYISAHDYLYHCVNYKCVYLLEIIVHFLQYGIRLSIYPIHTYATVIYLFVINRLNYYILVLREVC